MSSKRLMIVGGCLVVTALLLMTANSAMAQRGGRGGGWGDARGEPEGQMQEGQWNGGPQASQGNYQSGAPQHPAPAAQGRQYSGAENQPYRGQYNQPGRAGADWRGGRGWGGEQYGYGYGRDWRNRGWAGWGPQWGWGGYGYGWPGYDYGYNGNYYGGDDYGDYGPDYYQSGPEPYASDESDPQGYEDGYYAQAVQAFERGDYKTALRLASHAEVEEPRDIHVHLLATLAMFALGDFRGAAMQAHALAGMRPTPTWDDVYELYGNVRPYTHQLRALERYVKAHQSSADARFLLGFLYLTGGYRDAALEELQIAQKLSPRDRFAVQLLRRAGGTPSNERIASRLEEAERDQGYQREGYQRQQSQEPWMGGRSRQGGQIQGNQRQPAEEEQQGVERPSQQYNNERYQRNEGQQGSSGNEERQATDREQRSQRSSRSSNSSTPQHPSPQNEK